MSEIKAIRQRLANATDGPWKHEKYGEIETVDGEAVATTESMTARDISTATFIANAPTDIQFLLDEVEKLTEMIECVTKSTGTFIWSEMLDPTNVSVEPGDKMTPKEYFDWVNGMKERNPRSGG